MSLLLDKLVTRLVLLLLLPLALLPLALGRRIGALFGYILFMSIRGLRRRVVSRIAEALPEMARINPALLSTSAELIGRAYFANLGRCFAELAKIHYGFARPMLEQVEFKGLEYFQAAKSAGRGVIFVTAHCGNWEASALAFGLQHEPVYMLIRHQNSPSVNELFENLRTQYGNQTIHKDGAARKVLSVIRKGGIVGILSDIAVPMHEGIVTPFMGRPAWTTPLPAVIAQKTGCALLPGFIRREGERLIVDFFPPLPTENKDVPAITAALSDQIGNYIANHPEEWFWFYSRWRNTSAKDLEGVEIATMQQGDA